MNDSIILVLDSKDNTLKGFIKKDKNIVDNLESDCIMSYLQAVELEKTLDYKIKRKLLSIKELLLVDPVATTDLINILLNKYYETRKQVV